MFTASTAERARHRAPVRASTWRYALWFAWTTAWTTTLGLAILVGGGVIAGLVVQAVGGPR